MPYNGERTAAEFFKFASLRVPNGPDKIMKTADIKPWIKKVSCCLPLIASRTYSLDPTLQHKKSLRALLLTKDSKVPLLWKVLASKYHGRLRFGTHRDEKGIAESEVGVGLGDSKSKVLIFSEGSTDPAVYEGMCCWRKLAILC